MKGNGRGYCDWSDEGEQTGEDAGIGRMRESGEDAEVGGTKD